MMKDTTESSTAQTEAHVQHASPYAAGAHTAGEPYVATAAYGTTPGYGSTAAYGSTAGYGTTAAYGG